MRLLDATGHTVVSRGADAAGVLDPVIVAARNDYASIRETMSTFSEADLKKMITSFALGTAEDVRNVKTRPKKTGFIDILWNGARRKLADQA